MDEKPTFQHPQKQTNEPAQGQVFSFSDDQPDQIGQLSQQVQAMQSKRINLNTDIIGLFETVTVAPTGVPAGPYDQIKISVIAGTTALNVYDAVNHVWKKVTIA